MKRLSLLIASLAAVLGLQAQTIPSGSEWFTGGMQYEATRHADGSVTMYMMNEGEETEYKITPVSGKPGQYTGKNFADETISYKLIQRAGQTILAPSWAGADWTAAGILRSRKSLFCWTNHTVAKATAHCA